MHIYIPEWVLHALLGAAAWYLAFGLVFMVLAFLKAHRIHQRHGTGWTWKDTLWYNFQHPFLFVFDVAMTIFLWPFVIKDL